MDIIIDILKYTLPSLICLTAVYFLFSRYLTSQEQLKRMELGLKAGEAVVPLRLQAYERLSLYCERIRIDNLLLRLHVPSGTADELRAALLITIQQEFEHNVSQQIYVSGQLWEIVKTTRDVVRDIVIEVHKALPPGATNVMFEQALISYIEQNAVTPIDTAQRALRTELTTLFGGA